jgi:hypothetical protein
MPKSTARVRVDQMAADLFVDVYPEDPTAPIELSIEPQLEPGEKLDRRIGTKIGLTKRRAEQLRDQLNAALQEIDPQQEDPL